MAHLVAGQVLVEYVSLGGVRRALHCANLAFKQELREFTSMSWGYTSTPITMMFNWPWRAHPNLAAGASESSPVRHGAIGDGSSYGYAPFMSTNVDIRSRYDVGRYRFFNPTPYGAVQGDQAQVIAGFLLTHNVNRSIGFGASNFTGSMQGNAFSYIDLGISQIGATYQHPIYTGLSITTTAGASYVTWTGFVDVPYLHIQQGATWLRIESGSDRGVYYIHSIDRQNSRAYLRNMDGSRFVAQASASAIPGTYAYRLAYFNETGVIPTSAGQALFDGLYDPGESRGSFIFKVHLEKSGSPSPSNEAQRGSYWFSLHDYVFGTGGAYPGLSSGSMHHNRMFAPTYNTTSGIGFYGNLTLLYGSLVGNVVVTTMVLDRTNQRLWQTHVDLSTGNSCFGYWNYKSPETFREVATSSVRAPNDPFSSPFQLASGVQLRWAAIGSDDTIYFALSKANDTTNTGWLAVRSDLTWSFMSSSSVGVPTAGIVCAPVVDRTRARTGSTGVATSTASGHITSTGAGFTNSDIGRCIKLSGNTQDNGTWLISAVNSATDVTVTQLNGSAVAFTGGSGGTFQIGDRIYLFVGGEATWNSNKMSWTDSLSFGALFTRTVTMTAGAQCHSGTIVGQGSTACVDPLNGPVFWYSVDGVKHLNKYDPSTGTVSQRPFSDLAVQVPGSNSNPTAPSYVATLAVNPNTYFRELWVSTDQGIYRFDPDTFSAQFARFYGHNNGSYAEADGNLQIEGSDYLVGSGLVWGNFAFLTDGQAFVISNLSSTNINYGTISRFDREGHTWRTALEPGSSQSQQTPLYYSNHANTAPSSPFLFIDPFGFAIYVLNGVINNFYGMVMGQIGAVHYQWVGGIWTPREVVRGSIPDATSSPGCLSKPLHTTLDDLVMGVKVKFTSSGAVGGENLEFLGRLAQRGTTRTDGATSSGTANFTGSGFTALGFVGTDVGRYYVRIESGADQGVYKIVTVTNDNQITLQRFNGVAFSASATAGTLSYSVWDTQAGSTVGPETVSVVAGCGFTRDNTQDVTGIYADFFQAKTLLSEQSEVVKFCTDILPPVGAYSPLLYWETYSADYRSAMAAHLALPGSPVANLHAIDGGVSRVLDDVGNRANMVGPSSWRGAQVDRATAQMLSIDLGADMEIGSIIVRGSMVTTTISNLFPSILSPSGGITAGGMHAHVFNAPASGGTPAASSTIRCQGTGNCSGTANTSPITTTGDFLGSATAVTGTDGVVNPNTIGNNIFQSTVGRFSQSNVGMVLRVTSGSDVGQYRILSVNGDGSQCTIRNLDQTAKVWNGAGTTISFTVYDGVQEEDLLCVPSLAVPTYRLLVERLSNDGKSAYVRITPGSTFSSQNWQCVKPSWNLVKRVSSSVTASPPEVSNNGTYTSTDGKESYAGGADFINNTNHNYTRGWKAVLDFSDLPSAKRTGRWWKWSECGRDLNDASNGAQHSVDVVEFYDISGKRLFVHRYCASDSFFDQAQFLSNFFARVDLLQSCNTACAQYAGYNGLATLGGTSGDSLTLSGGNKFLGFQLRPRGTSGSIPGGSAVFNGHSSDPAFLTTTDVGRFLRIHTGANAGVYRIATVPSSTQVTLTTINSTAVNLTADAGPVTYSIHEGINFGSTNPDFVVLTTGGNRPGLVEMAISAVSDDLTTITVYDKQFKSLSNQSWEIRRRALEDRTVTPGTNANTSARLLYTDFMYPMQSGDVCQDIKGYLKFWPGDVGGTAKTGGAAVNGTANFQSSVANIFTDDDVGRILLITSGVNRGAYRITALNSTVEVALADHFTGNAAVLTGDASVNYTILGERRYRASRYVTALRS